MDKPLVTVLLTVYNRPSVVRTVNSILNQTYKNIDLLIVDNASTDNTCDEIRKINDDRIRLLINEKNGGQTYSLIRGINNIKGKYIARIDADDIALPDRIEKQVDFLEKNPEYVLCGSWVQYINDDDQYTLLMKMPTSDIGLRTMQMVTCGMYHPAAMYRTSTIKDNNINYDPDIYMAEDYEMWRKLLQYGKGLNLPEALVLYRRGSNNDSTTHQETMGRESFLVRKKVVEAWENSKEKKMMQKVISIEEQNKKTISDIRYIWKTYKALLKDNMDKGSDDYKIIRKYFVLKVYTASINNNTVAWARCAKVVYKKLLSIRYHIGKKH